jgi:hypothetical protein
MIGVAIGMILFAIIILGVFITIAVLYLLNLQNLLKQVGQERQLVPPTNVWLMFIPFFNIIYPFILYPRICDSIKAEFEYRGMQEAGDYGRGIGIAMPILGLCGIIPVLGVFAGIANFILFIVFWVKMADYKSKLINSPAIGITSPIGSSTELLDS